MNFRVEGLANVEGTTLHAVSADMVSHAPTFTLPYITRDEDDKIVAIQSRSQVMNIFTYATFSSHSCRAQTETRGPNPNGRTLNADQLSVKRQRGKEAHLDR